MAQEKTVKQILLEFRKQAIVLLISLLFAMLSISTVFAISVNSTIDDMRKENENLKNNFKELESKIFNSLLKKEENGS